MTSDSSWEALLRPGDSKTWFAHEPRPTLEPQATHFTPANAWWLAELCRLVYRRGDREQILRTAGLTEERFVSVGAAQCAIVRPCTAVQEDFVILVFRGTSQLSDWLTNLRTIPADWPEGGKVHDGFGRAFEKIWPILDAHLRGSRCPRIITGHSLGGALATLCASRHPPRSLYTFGSPRVGNQDFKATLEHTPVFRITNHRDIVITVPPSIEQLGFTHVGEQHDITPDDSTLEQENRDRRWFDPAKLLSDHAPINYVARVADLLEG